MSGSNLVIVESPAKAKTINKYLGSDYTVLASYGHVRDLPPKDGSVRPEEDFAMDWDLDARGKKRMDELARAAKEAKTVYLATDPDREGEAISWHVREVLQAKRGLKNVDFQRITFNEITKTAVNDAIRNPRGLDEALIQAYLARRALDSLVGFTLSPVLWRKLPGSRSAGRVQSVALRLVCEREAEIENFRPQEYWTVEAVFTTEGGETFTARLTHLDGKKLGKFDLATEADARAAKERLEQLAFTIAQVERKQVRRNPAPPFTTSTLQQEASRKLGMGASQTMRTAQRLYEGIDIGGETVGLITYMRTDGLQLAREAVDQTRDMIRGTYGGSYVPDRPRVYQSTQKNAQEAHEAIRPTDPARRPEELGRFLDRDQLRLYELIWKRTVACQMESAVLDQVAVDVAGKGPQGSAVLRATGSIVKFDGFLKVYEEGRDDVGEEESKDRRLPAVAEGQGVERGKVAADQHFTQPPPRYSEASLVKKLEELGIGRPSTYASILQVLQDREYVRLDKRRFQPEDRGRLVTSFLTHFFRRYVEYDFTAKLEAQLDDISGGRADWKEVLRQFWDSFAAAVEETKDLTITQVIDALDEDLGAHFFRSRGDGDDPRRCPRCGTGRLGLKLAKRSGAFIGCSNYPECTFTRPLEVPSDSAEAEAEAALPRHLGEDPETKLPVTVRKGPFGIYAQLGEGGDGEKPKRVSLPKGYDPFAIDLDTALALLSLPRVVTEYEGKEIKAGVGRYGPYLFHDGKYVNLPEDDDVLTVGANRAVDLVSQARSRARGGASATPLRELGEHDGQPVAIYSGRYGPYIKYGKLNVTLPKGDEVESIGMDRAVELIAAKAAKGGKGTGKRKAAAPKSAASDGKAPPKKAAAKKTTAKKTAPKSAASKASAPAKGAAKKAAAKKPAAGNGAD